MRVTAAPGTAAPGVLLIEPTVFCDARGFLMEAYNARRYAESGIAGPFVQDNVSLSRRGVLRGLHFQEPGAQGKLVYVLLGSVWDVAVDVRVGSPTFGRWVGEELSAENRRQLWVPPGYAHGFLVTSDEAVCAYKCTAPYRPDQQCALRWDDAAFGIAWPDAGAAPTLSARDAAAPALADVPHDRLPRYIPPA